MSVNPTEYDITQDTRIDGLEDLVANAGTPQIGAERSFPIVGQPMDDHMWQSVTLGIGDGILDDDGGPYFITNVNDQASTVTVRPSTESGLARAILRGFYHELSEPVALSIPAVATPTTYHIGLVYDPLQHQRPGGPIKLEVWTGNGNFTSGRIPLELYRIPRQPSQVLSAAWANRTNTRRMISPTQVVGGIEALPSFDHVLWGTQITVLETGHTYRADSSGWINMTDSGWKNLYLWQEQVSHSGRPCQYKITGNRIDLRGQVARKNGANFTAGRDGGWGIGSLPGDKGKGFGMLAGAGTVTIKYEIIDGQIRLYLARDARFVDLGGSVAWLD